MYKRFVPFLWFITSLAFAGCNQPADNSAQIQTLNDKIRDLQQREQELKLQSERDKLDAERAALEAERRNLEAQKAAVPPGSPVNRPAFADASPAATRHSRQSDRDDSDVDEDRPAPSRASYDVFYENLQEGGRWFNDDTYGYVWQPDVAAQDPDWRPYTDGHWIYTDRGWTWVSNERFGWACYHYGRWARLRDRGWIWVPGHQWAPAWVSWRESNDEDYVGWAPLPPECEPQPKVRVQGWVDRYNDIGPAAYVFVKMADILRPSYRQAALPPQQNVDVIERTRNITDIYYDNQTVNNYGPQYERVARRVNQPVAKYQIDYVTPPQPNPSFQTVLSGNRLQVIAPPARLQPRATVQPPVAQPIRNAQVERGWQNIDPNRARQISQALVHSEPPVPKDLPPQPVPPPKPVIVARQSPGAAPAATPASSAAGDLAAQRARLEAEKAQLLQQLQATQHGGRPNPAASGTASPPTPGVTPPGAPKGNVAARPPTNLSASPAVVPGTTPAPAHTPPGVAQRQAEQAPPQQPVDTKRPSPPPADVQSAQQLKAQQDAARRQAEQQAQQPAEQQRRQQEAVAAKRRELEAQTQQQLKAQQEGAQRQAEQQRAQQEAAQRQAAQQQQQQQQEAAQRQQAAQAQQQRAQQEAAQRQAQQQQEAAQRQAEQQRAQQQAAQAQQRAQQEAAQRQAQQQQQEAQRRAQQEAAQQRQAEQQRAQQETAQRQAAQQQQQQEAQRHAQAEAAQRQAQQQGQAQAAAAHQQAQKAQAEKAAEQRAKGHASPPPGQPQ